MTIIPPTMRIGDFIIAAALAHSATAAPEERKGVGSLSS